MKIRRFSNLISIQMMKVEMGKAKNETMEI